MISCSQTQQLNWEVGRYIMSTFLPIDVCKLRINCATRECYTAFSLLFSSSDGPWKEEVNDELQQLFQYLLDTAIARIPEEDLSERLNEVQFEGCLETLKELARGISENIVELIINEGRRNNLQHFLVCVVIESL